MTAEVKTDSAWTMSAKMERAETLEQYIDAVGAANLLHEIAEILQEKADHIADGWQDIDTARAWTNAAVKVERAAEKLFI